MSYLLTMVKSQTYISIANFNNHNMELLNNRYVVYVQENKHAQLVCPPVEPYNPT